MSKLPQFLLKESKRRVSDDSFYEDSQLDPKAAVSVEPSKSQYKPIKEDLEAEEIFALAEPVKQREFNNIGKELRLTILDDNMTPYLWDILAELDRDVWDTELVFKEYVNGIIQDTEVLLTNSTGFESTLVKAVSQYEDKASELILDVIEKYNLPSKLMKLNQLKLRNKVYVDEIAKQPASKQSDSRTNNM